MAVDYLVHTRGSDIRNRPSFDDDEPDGECRFQIYILWRGAFTPSITMSAPRLHQDWLKTSRIYTLTTGTTLVLSAFKDRQVKMPL